MLEDIAILTDGKMIAEDLGIKLENVTLKDLGRAKRVIVDKDNTTIVEGAGKKSAIEGRISQIRAQIEETTSDYDREKLQERLAKLAGGVAVVKVGAATEVEMKEKKARVEDALHATRAAVEEGIVSGGGVALIRAAAALANIRVPEDERVGVRIVQKGGAVGFQVALGVLGGEGGFAEHVVGMAVAALLERARALERLVDAPAHHELAAHDAHRLTEGRAHDRLAEARDEPAQERRRVADLDLRVADQPARQHQAPGRGVDEQRVGLAQVLVPVGAAELVGDQLLGGGVVRDAQQRLGEAHQHDAFARGEVVLAQQRVDAARLALPAADRLDEGRGRNPHASGLPGRQRRALDERRERRRFVGEVALGEFGAERRRRGVRGVEQPATNGRVGGADHAPSLVAAPAVDDSVQQATRALTVVTSCESRGPLSRRLARARVDADVAGLRRDAAEPGAHARVRREVVAALVRDVRVRVQRDVGDRVALGDEEPARLQVPIHDGERGAALRETVGQLRAARMVGRQVLDEVARRRDIRLVAVLLEEHPLQHLRAAEPVAGHERRPLGQVPEDRVRLGEVRAVVELERRDAAVRVALQELRLARCAGVDVDLGPAVVEAELREQQPGLVAVARIEIVEELHGGYPVRISYRASVRRRRGARDREGLGLRLSYS